MLFAFYARFIALTSAPACAPIPTPPPPPQVTEEVVWEAFVQAGPVVNVYVPKDRVSNAHQGYAFVEYRGEDDADYVSGMAQSPG